MASIEVSFEDLYLMQRLVLRARRRAPHALYRLHTAGVGGVGEEGS